MPPYLQINTYTTPRKTEYSIERKCTEEVKPRPKGNNILKIYLALNKQLGVQKRIGKTHLFQGPQSRRSELPLLPILERALDWPSKPVG